METGDQSGFPSTSGSSGVTKPKMGDLSDLESDIHPFRKFALSLFIVFGIVILICYIDPYAS